MANRRRALASFSPGGTTIMFNASRHIGTFIFLAAAATLAAWDTPVLAQQNPNGIHEDNGGMNGSLSHEDLNKLGGEKKPDADSAASRDAAQARAKARAESEELIKALQLSCSVTNAQLVINGTRKSTSGGKDVETKVYEVACDGNMGYLLETQGSDKPLGISCLTAEEARASDAAKGKPPGFFCKLPENKDVYATVATMVNSRAGTSCEVRDLQMFGRSESTQSDYSEIVCKDGKGFLLRFPEPGSQAPVLVMNCADAAKQGIKCKLTDAGPVEAPITTDTFKSALAQNGVSCKIDQLRLIGQEDNRKRYVVEYQCADQPAGTVAFIPLTGNTNKYESIDCAAAAARGVLCKLTATH
jgi:hypothetical protein